MDKKELDIETIETPKGNVPTIKGLETAINFVLNQNQPLVEVISTLSSNISSIKQSMDSMSSAIHSYGESFAEIVILMGKVDQKITKALDDLKEGKVDSIQAQQNLLVELQTIMAKILLQFQELPLSMNVSHEE